MTELHRACPTCGEPWAIDYYARSTKRVTDLRGAHPVADEETTTTHTVQCPQSHVFEVLSVSLGGDADRYTLGAEHDAPFTLDGITSADHIGENP